LSKAWGWPQVEHVRHEAGRQCAQSLQEPSRASRAIGVAGGQPASLASARPRGAMASIVAVDPLAPLVAFLRLDRKRGDGAGPHAAQRDRLAGLLAIAVGAVVEPRQRGVDLGDELALAIARAQLDGTISFR